MFNHSWRCAAVLLVLPFATGAGFVETTSVAQAQSVFREDLGGTWRNDMNDRYVLRSNGTYTFLVGEGAAGNVSHSGTWSLRSNNSILRLHATRRVVREGRQRRTLKANKTFEMDITSKDPETITLDGIEFHRPIRD